MTVDREDVTVEVENAAGGWDRLKLPTAVSDGGIESGREGREGG